MKKLNDSDGLKQMWIFRNILSLKNFKFVQPTHMIYER